MANEPAPKQQKIQIKYEDMTARYANQVVLTTGQEEIFLDFCSGIIPDQGQGYSTLPIHTRIAMSVNGIRRLHQSLGDLIGKLQQRAAGAPAPEAKS